MQSRDYVVLLVAQILSEIGDWAARVALAVLVLDRTDSAAMTGLVVTFSVLPWIGVPRRCCSPPSATGCRGVR